MGTLSQESILTSAVVLVEWLNDKHYSVDELSEAARRLRADYTRRTDTSGAWAAAGPNGRKLLRGVQAHLALLQGGLLPALRIDEEQGFRDLAVASISYIAACFRAIDKETAGTSH